MPDMLKDAYFPAITENELSQWTIADLLRQVAAEAPERKALIAPRDPDTGQQRSWSYRELLAQSEQAACALLRQFKPGERVAIWASNRPEWALFQLGAALAGLTIVPINPANRKHETGYILKQSRAVGIVYAARYRDVDAHAAIEQLRPELPDLRASIPIETWDAFVADAATKPLPDVDPRGPGMILYTSGTTGKPKGAVLSHVAVLNNTKFSERRLALDHGSVWLNCLPMFHSSGCVFALICPLWNRGTHLMLPGFEAPLVLRCIEEEEAAWLAVVPTMAIALLDDPSFKQRDMSSLRVVVAGGTTVPDELVRRIERDFGAEYMMVFGQTEASGVITQTRRGDSEHHRARTVGIALDHMEVRIVDRASGRTLCVNEVGEICLRGYATLLNYFDLPQATTDSFDSDGWFHTGDIGTMQADGYLTITGRLKEMAIRGGENIYPREVEDVLVAHPMIADVAVFGVPDPKWGEQLAAAVRLRTGATATGDELKAFLHDRIARHKIPFYWWFVDEFPTTVSGKIQKFELRRMFVERMPANVA